MRIHYVQHVPFEDPGSILEWASLRQSPLSRSLLFEKAWFPSPEDVDCLVVMGGPMGVNDDAQYPWLPAEKRFLHDTIMAGKFVVGICLGAQLIAHVLGARVYRNAHREIGWFAVSRPPEPESRIFRTIPESVTAFHWHGDTFDLPSGAVPCGASLGCARQAFTVDDRVIALQFHLETTEQGIEALIAHCRDEMVCGPFVQSEEQIRLGRGHLTDLRTHCFHLMDNIETAFLERMQSA